KEIQDEHYDSEAMNKFDPDHPYHEVSDFGILLELYQSVANHAHDNKQFDKAAIGGPQEDFFQPPLPRPGHARHVFLHDLFHAASTQNDLATATAIAKLFREMSRDPKVPDDMDKCVVVLKKKLAKH